MGLIAQCDGGCGATTDNLGTFSEFGIVKKVWYCDACKAELDDLYQARDDLHTFHAFNLQKDLLKSLATFRKNKPEGKLPDAPD